MNKPVKAAGATVIAAALLMGGATTLAYWSDSTPLSGGSIATGAMSLGDATCSGSWLYAAGNPKAGETVGVIVPGDTIVKTCTFAINATGDNLTGTFSTPSTATVNVTSTPKPTTLTLNVGATYVNQGGAELPAQITSANNGDVVTATLSVEFPFGDATQLNANDTQNVAATLDDITVTLSQTEA